MIAGIAVYAVALFGLVLAFAYKPSKRKIVRELGFLLIALAVGVIILFPALLITNKALTPGKALLASIWTVLLIRYAFFGAYGILGLFALAVRFIRGRNEMKP